MLRPEPMGWVDIVLEKRSASGMLEAVADTEVFEPDRPSDPEFGHWNEISPSGSRVRELWTRIRRYQAFLPASDTNDTTETERSAQFPDVVDDLERRVDGWLEQTLPDLEQLSALNQQRQSLGDLRTALSLFPASAELDLWRSQEPDSRSYAPVIILGAADDAEEFLAQPNTHQLQGEFPPHSELAVLRGVVRAEELDGIRARCRRHGLQALHVPDWVEGSPEEGIRAASRRIEELDRRIEETRRRVSDASRHYRIAGARWLIERQDWLEYVLEQAHQGRNFVHIGGWVPRHRYPQLVDRLKETGRPFLVRLDEDETHGSSPTVLRNPSWVRNFELFVTGFGTPDIDEVDPSIILALITPLMFGYMFGDVGQGLLLIAAGWTLGGRLPWIRLLVPAGISAVMFGFLYGSVFSVEHWIPPLWIHPMEKPLIILGVPVVFGALLMLVSMGFGCIEARWRGKSRQWFVCNLPLIACYLAPAAWYLSSAAGLALLIVALTALLWPSAAARGGVVRRLASLPGSLLELLEQWVQLIINTLSFARLGAFSLAHAGLGMALLSLAALPDSFITAAVILVLGNLVITALEGLVVSVQTTRLVMFEFFRRFFEGTGRRFRPLTLEGHPGDGGRSRT